MNELTRFTISLSQKQRDRLDAAAIKLGNNAGIPVSVSAAARKALEIGMNEMEKKGEQIA